MINTIYYDILSWGLIILGAIVTLYILIFGRKKVSQGLFLSLASFVIGLLMLIYKLFTK